MRWNKEMSEYLKIGIDCIKVIPRVKWIANVCFI